MRTLIITGLFRYGQTEHHRHTIATTEADVFHFAMGTPFSLGARNATTVARALVSGERSTVDEFGWTTFTATEVLASPSTVRRVIPNGLDRRRNVGESAEDMRACMLAYAVRGAESLQWAEDTGHTFDWSDDWSVGSHFCEYGEAYAEAEPDTCEQCVMYDADGEIVASLSCIDNADSAYRQEIETDLAWEAMPLSVQPALFGSKF